MKRVGLILSLSLAWLSGQPCHAENLQKVKTREATGTDGQVMPISTLTKEDKATLARLFLEFKSEADELDKAELSANDRAEVTKIQAEIQAGISDLNLRLFWSSADIQAITANQRSIRERINEIKGRVLNQPAPASDFNWFPASPLSTYLGLQGEFARVKLNQGSTPADQLGLLTGLTLGSSWLEFTPSLLIAGGQVKGLVTDLGLRATLRWFGCSDEYLFGFFSPYLVGGVSANPFTFNFGYYVRLGAGLRLFDHLLLNLETGYRSLKMDNSNQIDSFSLTGRLAWGYD